MENCSIYREPIRGYGNNAEPLRGGECCDRCNEMFIIPYRLMLLEYAIGRQAAETVCRLHENPNARYCHAAAEVKDGDCQ
jgi:hypothetical protein